MRNAKQIQEVYAAREAAAKAEISRVDRIKKAVSLEIRSCTDRAAEIVEGVRARVAAPPPLKLVKVPR